MMQRISYNDWLSYKESRPDSANKLLTWAYNKRYVVGGDLYMPTIGELIEFLSETNHHHRDDILSGVRDHNIEFENFTIAWDGDDLVSILWWQTQEVLKKL